MRTIRNSGLLFFLLPVGGLASIPRHVLDRKDTPCGRRDAGVLTEDLCTGNAGLYECFSVTRQMSVWLTLIKETGAGATFQAVCVTPELWGRPPTKHNIHRPVPEFKTHTHIPGSAEQRAVRLYHSTRCRQGWTLSSRHGGAALVLPHTLLSEATVTTPMLLLSNLLCKHTHKFCLIHTHK